MRLLIVLILSVLFSEGTNAQAGIAYCFKGSLTACGQSINGFSNRDPLSKYHGAIAMESIDDENKYAIYGQFGYHVKGSAVRSGSYIDHNGNRVKGTKWENQFQNLSLALGAKQKFPLGPESRWFYLLAIRGDVNIGTDLKLYRESEKTVNTFTFGITVGGGMEFPFSKYVGGMLEISLAPDFSNQMYVPLNEIQPTPTTPFPNQM